jgi:hypothetical protein
MNKISNAIKCVNCRNLLDSPIVLPCGCSVCKIHTMVDDNEIRCFKCEIEYPLSSSNFPPNSALIEIIEAKFDNLDFGHAHANAMQSCKRLDELLANIELILQDPFYFTYEAIEYLKNVAQLKVDEIKLLKSDQAEFDENFGILISKLDEFKANCKSHLSSNEFLNKSMIFEIEKDEARKELNEWFDTLNELKVNEIEWRNIKSSSERTIERFNVELDRFKSESLFQKRFEVYRAEIESTYGRFEIDSRFKFIRL